MICNQKPLYMPNLSNISTVLKLKNNRLKSMSPSVARTEIEFTIKTPSPKLQTSLRSPSNIIKRLNQQNNSNPSSKLSIERDTVTSMFTTNSCSPKKNMMLFSSPNLKLMNTGGNQHSFSKR